MSGSFPNEILKSQSAIVLGTPQENSPHQPSDHFGAPLVNSFHSQLRLVIFACEIT